MANTTATTLEGTIKTLLPTKGYGFIFGPNDQEYFFHRDEWQRGVQFDEGYVGQRVSFTPVPGKLGKGPRATNVRLV